MKFRGAVFHETQIFTASNFRNESKKFEHGIEDVMKQIHASQNGRISKCVYLT